MKGKSKGKRYRWNPPLWFIGTYIINFSSCLFLTKVFHNYLVLLELLLAVWQFWAWWQPAACINHRLDEVELYRQTSYCDLPHGPHFEQVKEGWIKTIISLTSSNNQFSEFQISNIYNKIFVLIFFNDSDNTSLSFFEI